MDISAIIDNFLMISMRNDLIIIDLEQKTVCLIHVVSSSVIIIITQKYVTIDFDSYVKKFIYHITE